VHDERPNPCSRRPDSAPCAAALFRSINRVTCVVENQRAAVDVTGELECEGREQDDNSATGIGNRWLPELVGIDIDMIFLFVCDTRTYLSQARCRHMYFSSPAGNPLGTQN
jgi:hypothetical protein